MSTHRHIDAICIVILVFTLLITGLFMNGKAFGLQPIIDEDAEDYAGSAYFTSNDLNGDWNPSGATRITLRGDHASVAGGGAYAYGGDVMITSAGRYVVSGKLDDGSIVVDTNNSAKVWILLNDADLSCSDGACLDIEQADKVFLTLAEGTENSMTTLGFSEAAVTAGMDGTLFSRDDLTINGTGTLRVTAVQEHGITANDELVITGGKIQVRAAQDALHVNDGLRLMAAELTLEAGDDGISLTGLESEMYLESGVISVAAADNGISAGNRILLAGCVLSVESGNDGLSASGEITVTDGELSIIAADDGIHSDYSVVISGSTIRIPSCYEGIEAPIIEISGGDITIYPEDDGLNANGGTDFFGGFGRPDMMPFDNGGGNPPEWNSADEERPKPPEIPEEGLPEGEMPEMTGSFAAPAENSGVEKYGSDETWIHISGGSITVINDSARDADGLDSNGDIIISGGVIRVSLTNSGSNSALDCGTESGGVMEISGGEVIACGSYAMAEGFDTGSTQCSILYNIKRGFPAGTMVSLENSDGKVILSYEVPCSFSSVAISCPEMKLGETYSVVIGDSAEEITLENVSASFGDAESERFGGPMNWGGMKFRPGNDMKLPVDKTADN